MRIKDTILSAAEQLELTKAKQLDLPHKTWKINLGPNTQKNRDNM